MAENFLTRLNSPRLKKCEAHKHNVNDVEVGEGVEGCGDVAHTFVPPNMEGMHANEGE